MKKLILLFLFGFLSACSSDPTEPEVVLEPDDEIVVEEETEEEIEEEIEEEVEEESVSIPFSLSVVLKNFSNALQREGDFVSIDFIKDSSVPTSALNLSNSADLDLNAGLIQNGQQNVLLFVQKTGTFDKEYVTYDLDTGLRYSVKDTTLLIDSENCFFSGSHVAANDSKIFAFNYDLCVEPDGIVPIVWNSAAESRLDLPLIERSYTGDTPHRIWANSDYFIVHFDDRRMDNPGESITQEGIYVYDSNSFELVFETRTAESKIPKIDGDKLIVKTRLNQLSLFDLNTGQTLFTNDIPTSEGINIQGPVGNIDFFENKLAGIVFDNNQQAALPGIYDFNSNSTSFFDNTFYKEYFKTSGLPIPDTIRQPKQHVFDLETETFAVLYHGFTRGFIQNDNPDFIGIAFLSFDGEIVYDYEFERNPWLEQALVKR